jgi:sterol desaturase/sphingolipid hydroxylase (fatty acid hydroxylase superfamily)
VFQGGSHPAMLMGVNLFTFGYYLFGYNLRHSHVWLSYGPAVSRVFISPAQHQIHHSAAKEHVDKNIGFVFSFWDMAAGTLCIPDRKMDIQFGLRHGEEKEYNSLARLFFLPFVKTARLFTKRRSAV